MQNIRNKISLIKIKINTILIPEIVQYKMQNILIKVKLCYNFESKLKIIKY